MKADDSTPDAPPRISVRPEEAAQMLGVSRSKLYEFLESGEIPSAKIGQLRLIPIASLHAFLARLTN